jgi:hypothetical protein
MPDIYGSFAVFRLLIQMGKPASNSMEKCTAKYCTLWKAKEQIVPCFRGDSGA